MKELSIEEKAKRYDEAIKVAKRNYETIVQMDNNCTFAKEGIVNTFHHIFPELIENGDEKIRKSLVEYLHTLPNHYAHNGICALEWLAWLEKQGDANKEYWRGYREGKQEILDKYAELEKQGEQKPKFRVGDTINNKITNEIFTISNRCLSLGYYHNENHSLEVKFSEQDDWELVEQKSVDKVEPKFKVGDWLVNIECGNVVMVLEVLEDNYRLDYSGDTIGTLCTELVDNDYRLWDITKDAKVGDIIYSRHNTESFEWIGIFKSLDKENKRVFFYGFWNNIAKSFSVCGNEAYVLYDDFSPATKEQRDLLFQKMKEAGYEWDAEKKELKKIKQKPTWSEEDEHKFKVVINALVEDYEATEELLNWFKSLKDRVQPKQELSEEDEEMIQALNACINVVIKSGMNYISFDSKSILIGKVKNYLKSLKNRYTWKPSDEQIEALESATENCAYSEYQDCLKELIVELKKLKE